MNIKKLFDLLNEEDKEKMMNISVDHSRKVDAEKQPKDEIHFQPEEGVRYYTHCADAETFSSKYRIEGRIELGNCFRTREKSKAVVKLRKHVVKMNLKYGRHDGNFLRLLCYEDGFQNTFIGVNNYAWKATCYDEFKVLHINSTEEERAERLRLIKAVYGDE